MAVRTLRKEYPNLNLPDELFAIAEDIAKKLGKEVERMRFTKPLLLACLYAAARTSGYPLRLKSLQKLTGVSKKTIVRHHRLIVRRLGLAEKPPDPKLFVKKFCKELGLPKEVEREASSLVELDGPNLAPAIAAGAVFFSARRRGFSLERERVERLAEISEPTLTKWVRFFEERV